MIKCGASNYSYLDLMEEPPHITLTSEDGLGCEALKKTIKFQCGLLRETETFVGEDLEVLSKDTLQDYICDMLNTKVVEIKSLLCSQLATFCC